MEKIKIYKPFSKEDTNFVSSHIESFKVPYALISGLIAFFEIIMIIRGLLVFNFSKTYHVVYFISYCVLFVASVIISLCLWTLGKFRSSNKFLYNTVWIYSFILILWASTVSYIDMSKGHSPIVFLTIMITISGALLLNPYIYNALLVPIVAVLIVLGYLNNFTYFNTEGDFFNLFIFFVMSIIINIKTYTASLNNYLEKNDLEKLLVTDTLTGLANETKYIRKVRYLEERISRNKDLDFIIVLMDVNNLKATNDLYGHRFGCHLIVEAAHILPSIFTNSDVYHVGGDEFIAIIDDITDYKNIENIIEDFKNELSYKAITYEGVDLILSVAQGYGVYKKGMKYSDVFQQADNNMYQNKKEMKEKYDLKVR